MTSEIVYNLFDFLYHIQDMYAWCENLYLYYAGEIIFYHCLSLSITTEKDDFFVENI